MAVINVCCCAVSLGEARLVRQTQINLTSILRFIVQQLSIQTLSFKENRLVSWVVAFTVITRVAVARLSVIHYFSFIFSYDNGYAVHSHFARLPRRSVDVFQSNIFWSFVFAPRQFVGRFGAMRITRSGKLDLCGGLLSADESWIQSRFTRGGS